STERSKIECNAIAYGLPESDANTATQRSEEDLHTLSSLLKSIAVPVPTEPKLIRLGNSTAKKPRPFKITSKNESSVISMSNNLNISPSPHYNVNIYYQNVRGLRTKLLNLHTNFILSSYDSCVLTETWLSDEISNPELGFHFGF
ncbi:Uncharacterized protein FWK35_00037545, partial [Aphis craccivora]